MLPRLLRRANHLSSLQIELLVDNNNDNSDVTLSSPFGLRSRVVLCVCLPVFFLFSIFSAAAMDFRCSCVCLLVEGLSCLLCDNSET